MGEALRTARSVCLIIREGFDRMPTGDGPEAAFPSNEPPTISMVNRMMKRGSQKTLVSTDGTGEVAKMSTTAAGPSVKKTNMADDDEASMQARRKRVELAELLNPAILELKKDKILGMNAILKSLEDANAIADGSLGVGSRNGWRDSEGGGSLNLKTVFEAKKLGLKARRKVQNLITGVCKVRTKTGIVSMVGHDLSKNHGKERAQEQQTGTGVGHFTPKNVPFRPIGGDIATLSRVKVKYDNKETADFFAARFDKQPSERDRMQESDVVPLNSLHGYRVALESHGEILLQIKMSECNEKMLGRNTVPRSLIIRINENQGGIPDIMVTPDSLMELWGLPKKDKCVWKTKDVLLITPFDEVCEPACPTNFHTASRAASAKETTASLQPPHPEHCFCVQMYTPGVYYLRITTGIEACDFNLTANLNFFTPEIDKARVGPGGGYRLTRAQKKMQVMHLAPHCPSCGLGVCMCVISTQNACAKVAASGEPSLFTLT